MSFLSYARRLFSLNTLDTRFTPRSAAPSKERLSEEHLQEDPRKAPPGDQSYNAAPRSNGIEVTATEGAQPSRWGSSEFLLYYIVFLVAIPLMFKSVYDVSTRECRLLHPLDEGSYEPQSVRIAADIQYQASHPNYTKYANLLSPGWIPGRKVDNSDPQYSGFRDNIPYMLLLLILHPVMRRIFEAMLSSARTPVPLLWKGSAGVRYTEADIRLERRVRFDTVFACVYLLALYGTSSLKVLVILTMNYGLAKRLPQSYVPLATWTFNIGILFANEMFKGYPYARIAEFNFSWNNQRDKITANHMTDNWGSLLDAYSGLLPRWEILFNITVLRLVSFNMDFCWSLDRTGGSPIEVRHLYASYP